MTVYGLDISHWQTGLKLSTGKDQGFTFVIAKMTEGDSYTDPQYTKFRDAAKAEGLLFAAYHFLTTGSDPVAQAKYAVSKLGDKSIPIMLDVETKDSSKPTVAQAKKFIAAVKAAGGRVSLVYLPHWYWHDILKSPSLVGLPAIVASNYVDGTGYGSVLFKKIESSQWSAYGGKTPAILQFTSKGKYTGYSGDVDFDVYKGTLAQLKAQNLFKDWTKKTVTTRKFDRVPSQDTRNDDYPVSLLWTAEKSCANLTAAPAITTKKWDDYAYLDQGSDGACVGFGTSGELAAEPNSAPNVDYTFAMDLYHDAQRIDEWPGEDYEGTSVLAGAKVAQNRGFYSSYLWATNETDVAATVSNFGPVIIGVNWHEDMMDTDADGFVHVSGEVVGGHCVVVIGIDVENGFYTFRNSWSQSWGQNGEGKISRKDMVKLIADDGDVCKPVRVSIDPDPKPQPEPTPVPANCSFWDKLFKYFSTGKWGC